MALAALVRLVEEFARHTHLLKGERLHIAGGIFPGPETEVEGVHLIYLEFDLCHLAVVVGIQHVEYSVRLLICKGCGGMKRPDQQQREHDRRPGPDCARSRFSKRFRHSLPLNRHSPDDQESARTIAFCWDTRKPKGGV